MIKKIIPFLIAFGIFLSLFYLLSQPPKTQTPTDSNSQPSEIADNDKYQDSTVYDDPDLIFYWGNGCPHCENVEKWLDQNNQDKKLKINYKEVYYNKDNQTVLLDIAKQYCPEIIETGGIGVPTGFDPVAKKCIQGDTPIIEFLTSKLVK